MSLSQKWKVMALIWRLLAGKLYGLSPRELSIAFYADSMAKKAIAKFRPCLMQEEKLASFVFVLRRRKVFLPSYRLFCFAKLFEMRLSLIHCLSAHCVKEP